MIARTLEPGTVVYLFGVPVMVEGRGGKTPKGSFGATVSASEADWAKIDAAKAEADAKKKPDAVIR